jgi:hypothetical protein
MLHDPTTVFCLLPLIYGLSRIDVYVFYIAHVESMEGNLHTCSITGSSSFIYEFGSHRKHSGYDFSAGTRYVLVFSLGTIGTPEFDEMHP